MCQTGSPGEPSTLVLPQSGQAPRFDLNDSPFVQPNPQ